MFENVFSLNSLMSVQQIRDLLLDSESSFDSSSHQIGQIREVIHDE
jgi:hypothetical protein